MPTTKKMALPHWLTVVVFASALCAQTGAPTKPPAPPAAPTPVPQPPLVNANGVVRDADKKGLSKATVTINGEASNQSTAVITDQDGKFNAQVPDSKLYTIAVQAKNFGPAQFQTSKEGLSLLQVILPQAAIPCCVEPAIAWWVPLIFALLYFLAAITVRYHNIVRVDRKLIYANLEALTQEGEVAAKHSAKQRIDALLNEAKKAVEAAETQWLRTFLFGFRGEEIAAHTRILDARERLVETYDGDRILSDLRLVAEELRPEYNNIALKIEATLSLVGGDKAPSIEFLRSELMNALRCVNEKKQVAWLAVMNWQNKSFALVFGGCGLLAATAMLLPNPVLLFVGLLGGFASRLMRGKTMSSADGSLTWTTLLLSPIYGAFAAWAGVLLITALTNLGILGAALEKLVWEQASCSNLGLGIAFLFGFSERFFSAVTDMAEAAVLKRKNASAADAPDSKPTPTKPEAGAQGSSSLPTARQMGLEANAATADQTNAALPKASGSEDPKPAKP